MNTKQETAAEVLAEMNRSADYGCRVTPLATKDWAARIERALSAQGEAVAYVPACFVQQIQDGETCVDALLWRERKDPSDFAVCPATHPAPARVTDMLALARGAWRAGITLGNNICVQESDRENDQDGDRGWINGTAECAKRIREWADPEDAQLVELLNEAGVDTSALTAALEDGRHG